MLVAFLCLRSEGDSFIEFSISFSDLLVYNIPLLKVPFIFIEIRLLLYQLCSFKRCGKLQCYSFSQLCQERRIEKFSAKNVSVLSVSIKSNVFIAEIEQITFIINYLHYVYKMCLEFTMFNWRHNCGNSASHVSSNHQGYDLVIVSHIILVFISSIPSHWHWRLYCYFLSQLRPCSICQSIWSRTLRASLSNCIVYCRTILNLLLNLTLTSPLGFNLIKVNILFSP